MYTVMKKKFEETRKVIISIIFNLLNKRLVYNITL